MPLRTRFIKGKGLVTEQVSANADSVNVDASKGEGFLPFGVEQNTLNETATLVAADAGMNVISGSGDGPTGTLKLTLPDPADVPLAEFGFRMEDARAHVLTSSAPASVLPFVPQSGSSAADLLHSSHVSMSARVGASAIFKSDGLHYLLLVASGTHTFA